VNGVAKDVQPKVPAVDRRAQVAAQGRQASHDDEAEAGAQRENLHHAQRGGKASHRDCHRRERQQCSSHPEDDANDVFGCHAAVFRASALGMDQGGS